MIIPSSPTVMANEAAELELTLKFWHPFENKGLNLDRPKSFQVWSGGRAADLLPGLKEGRERGFVIWSAGYKPARPGLHVFTLEPQPYWEPEEDKFIIHYPKVYVDAFGDDEGWDQPLPALKTEIVPLVKPGALYAGNVFTGRVLLDGRPVPGAEVEVEWYPGPGLAGRAPYESMITQVLRADANGVFSYAAPRAGWWGLAALSEADYKLPQGGRDKAVELGAVLWLYFHDFPPAVPVK
jgi:cobalt/nickel transport protein